MVQIFRVILSLSISGGLIGLLIMLLRPMTRRFFAKKWTYYLWLLVLVRMMVPVHVDLNMMEYLSGTLAQMGSLQNSGENVSDSGISNGITPVSHDGTVPDQTAGHESAKAELEAAGRGGAEAESGKADKKDMLFRIAGILWISGIFLSAAWRMYTYRGFVRGIRADCIPVTEESLLAASTDIQRRLNIGSRVPLYKSGAVNSPMLIGVRRPCIILPPELLTEMAGGKNEIRLILHHELVHYKRRDIWYKWLFQAVLCIHWFNPLLYWFNRKFHVDCELACDEMVMTILTEEGRKAYGNVLLDVADKYFLDHAVTAHKNVPAMTLLEEKRTLKERLRGIVQYHKKGVTVTICSLMVLTMLIIAAIICGVSGLRIHTGQMVLLTNETESPGFMRHIGNRISDVSENLPDIAFITGVNKNGNAFQMYDDDTLIAGNSESDVWNAHSYKGGGQSVECQKFRLNGSDELWIMYANKETVLEISSSFTLQKGRFKIVHVTPDGTVRILNENGGKTTEEITLPEGRNRFKIVGQEAQLEDLTVAYSNIKEKDIDGIYRTETEEYGNLVITGEEPLDMSRIEELGEACVYLEDEEVSRLCQLIWEEDVHLSDVIWQDMFVYSDSKLTTRYLLEALQAGGIKEFDSRILCMIAPYMEQENVSECFRHLLERGKVAESDWEDIFIYSDASLSAEYLVKALQNGKVSDFGDKALGQICYQVSVGSLTDIVTALTKEELSFNALLEHILPFIQKQGEAVTCVCYYIDLGNILTDAQLREIEGFVSEEDFYRIVEYNGKRK